MLIYILIEMLVQREIMLDMGLVNRKARREEMTESDAWNR
jgi:hypothetical protein